MADKAQIKRATLAAHRGIEQLDAASLRQIEAIYRQAADDIAERIKAHAGPDDNLALQEMRSVLVQIEVRLRTLSDDRNTLINVGLERAAELGTEPIFGDVQSAAAMRVSDEALRFVRNFVAEDGLQLSDRIWRLDRGARDTVINAIEQAVIQGQGAAQAAGEFLARGEPVPLDVQGKLDAANGPRLARQARDQLLTGTGAPLDHAMRLMRTEINRAHGEAFMASGEDHPDFAGWRFLLSPAHPKPDICDLLSTQNLYGLGEGVYPSREKCPWPAHPNTLSFLEIVFKDEITDADRAGKETPVEALARLTAEQRAGVLGKGKTAIFEQGKLAQGMIRARLRDVEARLARRDNREPVMNLLPNHNTAQIDAHKLEAYALNADHPVGGNKAKRFKAALGFEQSNADQLAAAIRDALPLNQASKGLSDKHGQRYSVDMKLAGPLGDAVVRTAWIVESEGAAPRLVSLYVKES